MSMLGFVGLGTMGQPMALNLLRGGWSLGVYARDAARATPLVDAGARRADSPAALADLADTVFVNVSDDAAVAEVLFGARGLAQGLRAGAVVVDMGTTSPAATREFAARLAAQEVALLDAPVSGGEAGARAGTLSIMVGGDAASFARVLPYLQALGDSVVHVGGSGAGQIAKACNQIAVSASLLGVAEALTFARREGEDAALVRQALLGGSAYSRILEVHGQRMLEENFAPGFKARLHRKDLAIVLAEAQRLGMALPVTALAAQHLQVLLDGGAGELDSAALIRVVEAPPPTSDATAT